MPKRSLKRYSPTGKYPRLRGKKEDRRSRNRPLINTSCGIAVRSKYEQNCVEYFCKTGIKFQYEPLIILGGRQFRPDFYLPEYEVFIEICGFGHMPYYNERVRLKQRLYEKYRMKAVFIFYGGKGSLVDILEGELNKISTG